MQCCCGRITACILTRLAGQLCCSVSMPTRYFWADFSTRWGSKHCIWSREGSEDWAWCSRAGKVKSRTESSWQIRTCLLCSSSGWIRSKTCNHFSMLWKSIRKNKNSKSCKALCSKIWMSQYRRTPSSIIISKQTWPQEAWWTPVTSSETW